ncbi:MAG: RNA polymerase sigma factor [Myxococcota bacterium]
MGEAPDDAGDVAEIFAQHYDFVWRALARLGVPPWCVDDATQDVFIVVHRRIGDYEPGRPVAPWLYGIARRVAHRHRTREAKNKQPNGISPSEPIAPEDAVANREAADLVTAFLATQPPEQREAFVLAELEGLTGPEIAEAIGVKLNTVYSRLRLSRRQFERAVSRSRAHVRREMRHASAQ